MIRLIHLLESLSATDDAKRKGLVKKPGFGLYGPPNGVATHQSRDGKLVPLKKRRTKSKKNPVRRKSTPQDEPTVEDEPTPEEDTGGSEFKFEPSPTARVGEIVDAIRNTLQDGKVINVQETLSAVTGVFGRKHAPEVKPFSQKMKELVKRSGQNVLGVYIAQLDEVQVPENIAISSEPIDQWSDEELRVLGTFIHESIHSTSPRVGPGVRANNTFYDTGHGFAIEEGLTEYLTHITINELRGPSKEKFDYCYADEVHAIKLMSEWGNLDIREAFAMDSDALFAEVAKQQRTALDAILTYLEVKPDHIRDIISLVDEKFSKEILSVVDKRLIEAFTYFINSREQYSPKEIYFAIRHLLISYGGAPKIIPKKK